jgi:hypothetical protein
MPYKPLLILMTLIVIMTTSIIIVIRVQQAITERINAMLHG